MLVLSLIRAQFALRTSWITYSCPLFSVIVPAVRSRLTADLAVDLLTFNGRSRGATGDRVGGHDGRDLPQDTSAESATFRREASALVVGEPEAAPLPYAPRGPPHLDSSPGGFQFLSRLLEVTIADDVVALEDRARLVAGHAPVLEPRSDELHWS